jgi:DNA-binding MarR family transcriptional regulator
MQASPRIGRGSDVRAFRADLRRLEREIGRALEAQTGCCGVTVAQCHILLEVEAAGAPGITDLVVALDLDKSTLSRTVDAMCRHGWLSRERDPENRRKLVLGLTRDGRARAKAINDLCDRLYGCLIDAIPASKRRMVLECVGIVAEAMRRIRREGGRDGCPL